MSAIPGARGKELYQFGPFRMDPEKGVLSRAGEPVPLTPKTFHVLLVLVRHNKEVVTKDDLMKSVWPDTFVEEANLSRNIFMLRKALGETEQDRYIVTVPGRGYRLAEDVEIVPTEKEISVVAASHSRVQVEVRETKPWGWIAAGSLVAIALAFPGWWMTHRRPVLTEKDSVLIADFANATGDPVFDATLRQGFAVQLEQSPYLSLVSEERVHRALTMMGKNGEAKVSGETAREVCERTGGAAVLEGSIASLGSEYVLGLRARNCRTGEVLDEQQVQSAKKEDVLQALTQMASRFRTRIGESLRSVQEHNTPLEEATTTSLEALKAYSAGTEFATTKGFAGGIPLLQHAIELDPKFALAHSTLGLWYSSMGESVLSMQEATRAYELRERASERERYFIDSSYARNMTGNLEKDYGILDAWAREYPRDTYPHALLSGMATQGTGRYERSLEEAKKAVAIDPELGPPRVNFAFSYLYLGKLEEAEAAAEEATKHILELPELYLVRYHVACLRNDPAGMDRAAEAGSASAGGKDWMTHAQALAAAHGGELVRARKLSQQAIAVALQSGQKERAANYLAAEGVYEAVYGNADAAKRDAEAALKLSSGRDVEYSAGFALALAGEYARTQELANDLEKRFQEDTFVRFSYLPTLRGLLALHKNDTAKALDALAPAIPQELAQTGISFFAFFGNLYPAYVRGEAYMGAKRYAEAIAEYRKLVDHPGIVLSDPMGMMARLQLARAYMASGDRANAAATYKQLMEAWSGADADLARVKAAGEEYAKLN